MRYGIIAVLLAVVVSAEDDPEAVLDAQAKKIREAFKELKDRRTNALEKIKKLDEKTLGKITQARNVAFRGNGLGRTVAPYLIAVSRHLAEAGKHESDQKSFLAEVLKELSQFNGLCAQHVDAKVAAAASRNSKKASEADAAARKAMADAGKLFETEEGMAALMKVPQAGEYLEENDPMQDVVNHELDILRRFAARLGKICAQPDSDRTKARNASIRAALKLQKDWQAWGESIYQKAEDGG